MTEHDRSDWGHWVSPADSARYLAAVRAETEEAEAERAEEWRDLFVTDPIGDPALCERCGGDAYHLLVAFTGDPTEMWECDECRHVNGTDDAS